MPTQLIVNKDPRKLEAAVNRALTSAPKGKRRVLLNVVAGANGEFVAVVVDATYVAGGHGRAEAPKPASPPEPRPAGSPPDPNPTRPHSAAKPKKGRRSRADGGSEG